jgi:CRISPR-associated protein Cmr3
MAKKHKQPPPKYRKQPTPPASGFAAATKAATAGSVVPELGQPKAASAPAGAKASTAAKDRAAMRLPEQAEPSPVVTLLPLAPIISRSGRPFDDQAGPDSARFPPPSTVAGCLRTAWARETNSPFSDALMEIGLHGPLLARPAPDGSLCLFAPRPADALYFNIDDAQRCLRAEPGPFADGCGADLPDGLLPVSLSEDSEGKEIKGPAWWAWEDLIAFRERHELSFAQLEEQGWSPPDGDRRTHVAIEPTTYAAKTGQLFQTEGLDLSSPQGIKDDPGSDFRLLIRLERPLGAALAHLGGERRLARIEPRPTAAWPAMPPGWAAAIRAAGGLSLTLLTPGLFSAGYRPGWLAKAAEGAHASRLVGAPTGLAAPELVLCAAALGRWQPHSGWDLAKQKPRAGRKLVPAGAVYWFALAEPEKVTDSDLAALWLRSVCDNEQDRRDGFGLALPAPWTPCDGKTQRNTPA